MRIFEYKCSVCESKFEFDTISEDHTCPLDSTPLKRVFSIGGISFKGNGFYRTDIGKK